MYHVHVQLITVDESEQASSDLVATSRVATTTTTTTTTTNPNDMNTSSMLVRTENTMNPSLPSTAAQNEAQQQSSASLFTSIILSSNGRQVKSRARAQRNSSIESSSSSSSVAPAPLSTPMHHENSNFIRSSLSSSSANNTTPSLGTIASNKCSSLNPYLSAPRLHNSSGNHRSTAVVTAKNHNRPQSSISMRGVENSNSNSKTSSRSQNPYVSSSSNRSVSTYSTSTNNNNDPKGGTVDKGRSSMSFTDESKISASMNFKEEQEMDTSLTNAKNKTFPKESSPMEIDLSLSPIQNEGMDTGTQALTVGNKVSKNGGTPSPLAISTSSVGISLSPTALTIPLSFEEFQSILRRVRLGSSVYKSYEGKTFIVPAKMKGNLKEFNIEKIKGKKGRKKSKGDKVCCVLSIILV